MRFHRQMIGGALAAMCSFPVIAQEPAAMRLTSASVSIEGTTNVHGYTASTSTVELAGVKTGDFGGDLWTLVQKPSLIEQLDIVIPAASLKSPKDGIDKNMHKALNVAAHKHITFSLTSLKPADADGKLHASGTLTINGTTKPVSFDVVAKRTGANLSVTGELPLLMTDYGVKPPKAMMGMMRTDPKVVIRIDIVLTVAAS